jgi:hypothetical protein
MYVITQDTVIICSKVLSHPSSSYGGGILGTKLVFQKGPPLTIQVRHFIVTEGLSFWELC